MSQISQKKTQYILHKLIVRYFSIRNRSERECTRYLQKKSRKFSLKPKAIEELVQKYRELGLLNDEKFAQKWTSSRLRSMYRGPNFILAELREKGVEETIIQHALKQLDSQDIFESAKQYLKKKSSILSKLEKKERIWKAKTLLIQRGFPSNMSAQVVDDWMSMQ